jgi:hypothetical protein
MSDNDQQTVARLVSELRDLRGRLAAKEASHQQTVGERDTARQQVAALQAELQSAQSAAAVATEQHKKELAAAAAQAETGEEAAAKVKNDYFALSEKFDRLYGPVEDGITLGPAPYVVTADNSQHPTLHAARTRKLGLRLELDDSAAAKLMADPAGTASVLHDYATPAKPRK